MRITAEEFDALFNTFRRTVFRLESLPTYGVEEEDEDLAAWRAGLPLPR